MKKITENIYQISLGSVNTFVAEDDGLTLIDTGNPGSEEKIFTAIRKAGKNPADIRRIILTHCHIDHAGSAKAIKDKLQIPVFMHAVDAGLIEKGETGRSPMFLSPGLVNFIVYRIFIKPAPRNTDPFIVDELLSDGDVLPFAGGMEILHTPGHCAGHIALLVKEQGLLIAGDLCAHAAGLGISTVNEDPGLSLKSILKASARDFDQAVFGHGKPLTGAANRKLTGKFRNTETGRVKLLN